MTQQMKDPFFWNKEEWVFLGAENLYSLFDPAKYGLSPTAPHTACWKGFIVQFRIDNKQLILDELSVFCENNTYPPINGIEARKESHGSMWTYNNIDLKLPYTGTIVIGKVMKPEFRGRVFTGPHSYETTFDLSFQNGQLISFKETSGAYIGF
ncbi:MAG: hypothetical protein K6G50_04965 [bacterium]|nr:hypothetical protein [bacterium]